MLMKINTAMTTNLHVDVLYIVLRAMEVRASL